MTESASTNIARTGRRLQVGLRSLLYIVLLAAIGLGWFRDHRQMEVERLRRPLELAICEEQIVDMTQRLLPDFFAYGRYSVWPPTKRTPEQLFPWKAVEFLDLLHSLPLDNPMIQGISSEHEFEVFASMIIRSPDDVYDEAITGMFLFSRSEDSNVRRGMAVAMRKELDDPRNRIEPYRGRITQELILLLNDAAPDVRREAMLALVGAEAREALESLRSIASNQEDPIAIHAAIAVAEIDPTPHSVREVKELIVRRQEEWTDAVTKLPSLLSATEAESFLRGQYAEAKDDADRRVFVKAINDVVVAELQSMQDEH